MTQQDKELLLKDLCARLPYGVKAHKKDSKLDGTIRNIEVKEHLINVTTPVISICSIRLKECQSYLRPMSSMTTEEKKEYYSIYSMVNDEHVEACEIIDWLNAHHFDYRGLIGKGLAIAVTKENNPYKNDTKRKID